MKVYQCIHKYKPHTVYFEETYNPQENNLSFEAWKNLLIEDGFAGCNILQPSDDSGDQVFYTLWDYENLQFKWAEEKGMKSRNLDEIKLAQIEELKPDVFYNISPNYDNNFIQKLNGKKDLVKVCWDSVIQPIPPFHEKYDLRVTLFEPYAKFWNQHGYKASILPPAFIGAEDIINQKKSIGILFFGQFENHFFSERNKILMELMNWSKSNNISFQLNLQFPQYRKPLLNIRGFRRFTRWIPVAPLAFKKFAQPPVYGRKLYQTIASSKIVINSFTNFNGLYKDNMRNYETIDHGAFLISEEGIYPEHFVPGKDFLTYKNTDELFSQIKKVLQLSDQGLDWTLKTREKLSKFYNKKNQWARFVNEVDFVS